MNSKTVLVAALLAYATGCASSVAPDDSVVESTVVEPPPAAPDAGQVPSETAPLPTTAPDAAPAEDAGPDVDSGTDAGWIEPFTGCSFAPGMAYLPGYYALPLVSGGCWLWPMPAACSGDYSCDCVMRNEPDCQAGAAGASCVLSSGGGIEVTCAAATPAAVAAPATVLPSPIIQCLWPADASGAAPFFTVVADGASTVACYSDGRHESSCATGLAAGGATFDISSVTATIGGVTVACFGS